jgi:predicted nucleic acid-binding Zn ribbon protein
MVLRPPNLLRPRPRPSPQPLGRCLEQLGDDWRRQGHLAALWKAWPRLAGPQLAPHCRPLALRDGILTVGAEQPQWRQALLYSRLQLIGAVRAAGHPVREIRIRQSHERPVPLPDMEREREAWNRHPSRVDVHGLATCPCCGSPAPAGELGRWGHCGFCRRRALHESSRQAITGDGTGAGSGAQ